MPEDFREAIEKASEDWEKERIICDFVSGMTDRYALEFYCRLFSENPESIFKPF
ncbi:MAG: hypothetical protein Q7I97_01740 [Thermovirgaceae bacterium]|nr:hypothetical protein [Thermovirgaceae bacterium]